MALNHARAPRVRACVARGAQRRGFEQLNQEAGAYVRSQGAKGAKETNWNAKRLGVFFLVNMGEFSMGARRSMSHGAV